MPEPTARLGRGLAALMDESTPDAGHARHDFRQLPLEQIHPDPNQPRRVIDDPALRELADSIAERGLLQPILVRRIGDTRDRYEIVAGERRWRAARLAGLADISCLVRDLTDREASAVTLVENLQRSDLNAIEEAEGLRRLMTDHGVTQEGVAKAIGKSRSYVANAVRLLNLPDAVQQYVRDGKLSSGHARALVAHADPARAADAVIQRGLSVRQTEQLVLTPNERGGTRQERQRSGRDIDVVSLEDELSAHLGVRVSLVAKGQGGQLVIAYQSIDQLDGILALLRHRR